MAWPTTSNPRTEFVTLRLTVAEAADLDALAQTHHKGVRSDAVRAAVLHAISVAQKRARKQQALAPDASNDAGA